MLRGRKWTTEERVALLKDNDHFFLTLLPFLKVTMKRIIMGCHRLASAFLLKSSGMGNNPSCYLNLAFQTKSYECFQMSW